MLVLVALFGLVDQAMSSKRFFVRLSDEKTIDSLLESLGKPIDDTDYPSFSERGYKVVRLLEKTEDKHKEKAVLDRFSIDDLLALNSWETTDCTDEGLANRRQQCESFCTREQTKSSDPVDKAQADLDDSSTTSNAYIKHNLGSFCWEVVEDMEQRCPLQLVRSKISENDIQEMWNFLYKTYGMATFNPATLIKPKKTYVATIKKNLAKDELVKATKIKDNCLIVVEGLEKPSAFKTLSGFWRELFKLCKLVKYNWKDVVWSVQSRIVQSTE